MTIRSVAVFCGSRTGNNQRFSLHARKLGILLAQRNIQLVYGGGNIGLMGEIANAVLEAGGRVTGVIPQMLATAERCHHGLQQLVITQDMHERKKKMYECCDAAVILPGGFGTLDELFEMITWNHLSIHNKKIFILNTDGFYDHLIAQIHQMHQHGFLPADPALSLQVIASPHQLEAFI